MSKHQIVGISGGRRGKVTEKAVKTILEASGLMYSFYSLSSFELLTCDACNGCVKTNKCIKDDNLNKILQAMEEADIIVFGSPEYWDGMNAKGRAFWERICFSTRHNSYFPLAEKQGVIVSVSGDGNSQGVREDCKIFFEDARINIIDEVNIQGEYACFTCGYGDQCIVGGLAEIYDLPLEITEDRIPDLYNQHPDKLEKGKDIINELIEVGKKLKS